MIIPQARGQIKAIGTRFFDILAIFLYDCDALSGFIKLFFMSSELPKLPPQPLGSEGRKRFRRGTKIALGIGLALIAAGGFLAYRAVAVGKDVLESPTDRGILGQIGDAVKTIGTAQDQKLTGEAEDRINILLLGMGGESDLGGGQFLTDTMILVSLKPSEHKASLVSIPRDLYVKIPGYWSTKINAAYALPYAENKNEFAASQKSIEVVETVTGQKIPYYIRVDFDGFKELVDKLGGVQVTVDTSFTDHEYPTYTLGYQTVSFKAGAATMDGETALKFARSRHGNNDEGTDFARAKRQQKLLDAVKTKALSTQTLLDPLKINGLVDALQKHIGTNLELWEINRLAGMAKDYNSSDIINRVIDNTNLVNGKKNSSSGDIQVPKAGEFNYSGIQSFVSGIFDAPKITQEAATIDIYNGTSKSGFGQEVASQLQSQGYSVKKVSNAASKTYDTTVLYDRTQGQKPESFAALLKAFGGVVSASDISPDVPLASRSAKKPTTATQSDIMIILGSDYYAAFQAQKKAAQQPSSSDTTP